MNAISPFRRFRQWFRREILDRLRVGAEAQQRTVPERVRSVTDEEKSRAELLRLQRLIEDRKQVARDTDISYHLWGLYESYFRSAGPHSMHQAVPEGEWYDVKVLEARSRNGLNEFKFELKGNIYRFVDDEELQGWRENLKFFSLYLHDGSGRCLIEVPMKMRVDSSGREYAILSDGPRAFLPGRWVSDFISVRLKHKSMRNQEIRSKKHRERLREIEDLKKRFGIAD